MTRSSRLRLHLIAHASLSLEIVASSSILHSEASKAITPRATMNLRQSTVAQEDVYVDNLSTCAGGRWKATPCLKGQLRKNECLGATPTSLMPSLKTLMHLHSTISLMRWLKTPNRGTRSSLKRNLRQSWLVLALKLFTTKKLMNKSTLAKK